MNDEEYATYVESWRQQAKRDTEAGALTAVALLFPACFPEDAGEDLVTAEPDPYPEFIEE